MLEPPAIAASASHYATIALSCEAAASFRRFHCFTARQLPPPPADAATRSQLFDFAAYYRPASAIFSARLR
jgi:hypothetical protein